MRALRQAMIAAGFGLIGSTGLHRVVPRFMAGAGAILMFHHVRPWVERGFAPNRLLEITPEFLEAILVHLRRNSIDIVTLDEAMVRLAAPTDRRFVVLTFDDGYRDNRDFALPILTRHSAPFTLYTVPGFANRSARLWWVELEEAVRTLDRVDVVWNGEHLQLESENEVNKSKTFNVLYWKLRAFNEADLRLATGSLAAQAGLNPIDIVDRACLDWAGLADMSRHALCTIGAHTMTHPRLAKIDAAQVETEMVRSREDIGERLGVEARHFAYPVGDPTSAGPREFETAARLGFATAVTTRPGLIFSQHATSRLALPRVSINGNWQKLAYLDALLSGAPFWLLNGGRSVAPAAP